MRRLHGVLGMIVDILGSGRDSVEKAGRGVPKSSIDALDKTFTDSDSRPLLDSWIDYKSHLVLRRTEDDAGYWSAIPANSAFSETNVAVERLNRDWYKSLPSTITGIGLLGTFFAILVALLDVRLVENRVQGLELLIQGLSGKFLSSVVALLCATLFIFVEKRRFHALDRIRIQLASIIDRRIPQLSATQVLVDMGREISNSLSTLRDDVADQTLCIKDFNTSLAPMLQQTFDESMTPTLTRMVTSIEELNQFLRAAEANRNDTINDSIHDLLGNLQASITGSINEMGGKFNESLSGSAQNQFESISRTLGETTYLLSSMNSQFASSQNALQEMIQSARSTTQDQIVISQRHLTDLSETMGQLMTGLSDRVNELGEQMSDAVQLNSAQAVGAAKTVMDRAEEWSTENAARLSRLLETHDAQLDRVVQTREVLESIVQKFSDSLDGLRQVSQNSQDIVHQITTAVASIEMAATNAASVHQNLKSISGLTSEQLKHLEQSQQQQKEIWEGIFDNMKTYQNTFGSVEHSATALLEQIGTNLERYQQVCENGFDRLLTSSDEHFANATQKLGSSVSELDDVLQELNESFGRMEHVRNNGNR